YTARAGCLAAVIAGLTGRADQVVISEIMYHPPAGYAEYIELRNLTATVFDIAAWRLRGGADYTFPDFNAADPGRTFLRPYERIVIASVDEATMRTAYSIPSEVRIYGPWQGNLDNAGERITVEDANRVAMCTVAFGDAGDWPVAADGAGHSLVLRDADRAVDDWRNWRASTLRLGTPGTEPVARADEPIANPELREEQGLTLVDYAAVWRYHDLAQDLGTAWREPDYNDTDWADGPGLLGVENSGLPAPGLQTGLTMRQQLTYYFRTAFTYEGTLANVIIEIDQIVDDGVVYSLNGVELGRVRVDPGAVTFNTPSNGTVSNATEETNVLQIPGSMLRRGRNVLAAEVHQTNTGSSDIVLGVRLRARIPLAQGDGLVINELLPGDDPPAFLEVFNPTPSPINLRDHYLAESSANLTQYRVPQDLPVPPGGIRALALGGTGIHLVNPATLYLTAPDGTTVLNAVRLELPQDGRSAGRKPDGGTDWFRLHEPTRGQPNEGAAAARTAIAINEVHFSSSNTVDWIELFNRSALPLTTDGLQLAGDRELNRAVDLEGGLEPHGFLVVPVSFPVEQGRITVLLADGGHNILTAHALSRTAGRDSLQAFPDGAGEWYTATAATGAAPNNPPRETAVVINEIMCDPPSNLIDGEFIELHNRGTRTVDVGGWRIEDGVRYRIPDRTVIPAGGFLVVAANQAHLRQVHPGIPIVGDYQGRLANEGERIRLLDATGNLADEVDFRVRGDWPDLVAGMGSSLELRHPAMDNAVGTSWTSSDESATGPWREFRYRGAYEQLRTLGALTDYREVYFHLVGDGHLVLKDLELIKLSNNANLLVNGDRVSPNNRSADGWLCQGTHWQSHFEGAEFHLISTGRGDNRPNRVELDTLGMLRGDACELRFKARWIYGNPRLVFSTWDHSIATSFVLEIPSALGTPGRANSTRLPGPAPSLADLNHSPAVPRSTDPVRVSARVASADPLQEVVAVHRTDNANGDAAWIATPMRDDGREGDETAADGIYTVLLTDYQRQGQIAQF
ncbi:MAG: lamin tail domain-containing protein, partial [Verrucomicrobiae bacterium]|nr:lamin tail domain-containing protein [Verrucomicrobiae bacterium]